MSSISGTFVLADPMRLYFGQMKHRITSIYCTLTSRHELFQALIVLYTVVAVITGSASLFALWHLAQIRKMSSIARATRKAASRRRMMIVFR